MAIRVRCISMLCIGFLLVPMAQANKIHNSANVSVDSIRSNTAGFGVIDGDLMNIVGQVMYGKTSGQVIDELVSTYGYGEQPTTSLAAIAQLLSQQLSYLSFAIESAQAIIAILPPTSPHIVAAKLMINELSVLATCAQTVLTQVQQNPQVTAPAIAASAASTSSTAPITNAGSSSNQAFATDAITLLSDVASTVASSPAHAAAAPQTTTSSATASVSNSDTHHHGLRASSR